MKGKTLLLLAGLLAVMAAATLFGGDGSASVEEKRMAEVLGAMAGAGRVEVALYYGGESESAFAAKQQKPTGAVVVAEGAGDLAVRLNLIRAVRTLLSLPENAVDVFVMEDGR